MSADIQQTFISLTFLIILPINFYQYLSRHFVSSYNDLVFSSISGQCVLRLFSFPRAGIEIVFVVHVNLSITDT